MIVRDEIEIYSPVNEQEKKDKELILKWVNSFDDVFTRKNEFGHFCSSSFVVNKTRDKVLMIYHNIYKNWSMPGGHADGETDLLKVAFKEVHEETGLQKVTPIISSIASLDILPVLGHKKNNQYVSGHVHLSVVYLMEADEREPLKIKEDENSSVCWIPIEKINEVSNEEHMKYIYNKLLEKLKLL